MGVGEQEKTFRRLDSTKNEMERKSIVQNRRVDPAGISVGEDRHGPHLRITIAGQGFGTSQETARDTLSLYCSPCSAPDFSSQLTCTWEAACVHIPSWVPSIRTGDPDGVPGFQLPGDSTQALCQLWGRNQQTDERSFCLSASLINQLSKLFLEKNVVAFAQQRASKVKQKMQTYKQNDSRGICTRLETGFIFLPVCGVQIQELLAGSGMKSRDFQGAGRRSVLAPDG